MSEGADVAPLPRADLLSLHETDPGRYPHLLESVADDGSGHERFDILFAFPEGRIELTAPGELYRDGVRMADGDFLRTLDQAWREVRGGRHITAAPFAGGWFLYLAYEFGSIIEPRLPLPSDAPRPLA
ncbi:MAG: aminodeoxychorismate synthase component I, partial [Acidiferrobacteraceae bacterium]